MGMWVLRPTEESRARNVHSALLNWAGPQQRGPGSPAGFLTVSSGQN